jgi:hypothetical protein
MANKNPTTLAVQKFFGKYFTAIEKAQVAEKQQRPMTALAGLV